MNKLTAIIISLFIVLNFVAFGFENQVHGEQVFEKLKKSFPEYFLIKTKNGGVVEVTPDSQIGTYVIERFSKKYDRGWILWRGTEPNYDLVFAQIYFHKGDDWIELCISKSFRKVYPKPEDFWVSLAFELSNANLGELFKDIKSTDKEADFIDKFLKIEFESVKKANMFYSNEWQDFCRNHGIQFVSKSWFYRKGATVQEWKEELKQDPIGRAYLDAYKKQRDEMIERNKE